MASCKFILAASDVRFISAPTSLSVPDRYSHILLRHSTMHMFFRIVAAKPHESEHGFLDIGAEDCAQAADDLTNRGARFHQFDGYRHQVHRRVLGVVLQAVQSLCYPFIFS